MNCLNCKSEILSSWKYCPECGNKADKIDPPSSLVINKLPERFLNLANDYSKLTGLTLVGVVLESFVAHHLSGQLSVIDSARRLKAGMKVRTPLPNGLFSLNHEDWLSSIYDNPDPVHNDRVWTTSGGAKYHSKQDCKGLSAGQNYARVQGKEIYNPQFVTLRKAAHIDGLQPCAICKPPHYKP